MDNIARQFLLQNIGKNYGQEALAGDIWRQKDFSKLDIQYNRLRIYFISNENIIGSNCSIAVGFVVLLKVRW